MKSVVFVALALLNFGCVSNSQYCANLFPNDMVRSVKCAADKNLQDGLISNEEYCGKLFKSGSNDYGECVLKHDSEDSRATAEALGAGMQAYGQSVQHTSERHETNCTSKEVLGRIETHCESH